MTVTAEQRLAHDIREWFGAPPSGQAARDAWGNDVADFVDANPLPLPVAGNTYTDRRGDRELLAIGPDPVNPLRRWVFAIVGSVVEQGRRRATLYESIVLRRIVELNP